MFKYYLDGSGKSSNYTNGAAYPSSSTYFRSCDASVVAAVSSALSRQQDGPSVVAVSSLVDLRQTWDRLLKYLRIVLQHSFLDSKHVNRFQMINIVCVSFSAAQKARQHCRHIK